MSEQQRRVFTEEFKREAVRLISSSGRTLRQVADDLGLGLSTLTRWKHRLKDVAIAITPNPKVTKELARLRKENEVLKQARDFLKKLRSSSAQGTKSPLDGVNTVCRAADEVQAH